jgi:ATP-dependent Clp protease ATP-binding subunit ClpA
MSIDSPQIEPAGDGFLRVPFVGRVAELARLLKVLNRVRQRRPGLVVVEGPAGIGKTALLRQFLAGEPLRTLHER